MFLLNIGTPKTPLEEIEYLQYKMFLLNIKNGDRGAYLLKIYNTKYFY